MPDANEVFNIAEEIRLAVAPVFLLTALAALSTLLSQRLARLLDRARATAEADEAAGKARRIGLRRRMRMIQWSVRCSISAAVLTCFVVIAIFATDTLLGDLAVVISTLFIGAMLLVVASLVLLMLDIGSSVSSTEEEFWDRGTAAPLMVLATCKLPAPGAIGRRAHAAPRDVTRASIRSAGSCLSGSLRLSARPNMRTSPRTAEWMATACRRAVDGSPPRWQASDP